MSSMFEAFHRELHDAGMQDYEVVRIRVTHDAIGGAPVAMPLTPERARSVTLPARGGRMVPLELVREIVVHPDDWRDLLVDPAIRDQLPAGLNGPPTRIYGLPVVNESGIARAEETR